MLIYLTTMLTSVCVCFWMQSLRNRQETLTSDTRKILTVCCLLLIAILGIVVGWRKNVGTDYGNYIDIYNLTKDKTYTQILKESEPFFGVLNLLCANIFDDYVSAFVLTALISVALIIYGLYKSSVNYPLSMFLLIAGMYYFDLFNGMRQMIATAIMFAAYPLVRKRKWLWLLVFTVIALQFHASAVIILTAFFYAYYVKPRSWINLVLICCFLFIFLNFGSFSNGLIELLSSSESSYSKYETMLLQADLGANVLRFALTAVPPLISMIWWPYLKKTDREAGTLVNLSLINACFMFLATKNWIFARFCMFFGIYNILLWPYILECFEPKSKRLMAASIVVVYFSYFWLIVHTDSNLLPYQSWLFGGVYA